MNKIWSGSSFPKALSKGNLTISSILNHGSGGGGTGEVGGDGGEARGGVSGGSI